MMGVINTVASVALALVGGVMFIAFWHWCVQRRLEIVMLLSLAGLVFLLSGCGTAPYFDAGVGYRVLGSDHYYRGELANPKDEPIAKLSLGTQWSNGNYCEWEHQSYIGRGRPFNDTPEVSHDVVYCAVRFGGQQ